MRKAIPPKTAYIDAGLAAFIAQAAVAGVLGVLLTMKGYWYRIKTFFGGGKQPEARESGNED